MTRLEQNRLAFSSWCTKLCFDGDTNTDSIEIGGRICNSPRLFSPTESQKEKCPARPSVWNRRQYTSPAQPVSQPYIYQSTTTIINQDIISQISPVHLSTPLHDARKDQLTPSSAQQYQTTCLRGPCSARISTRLLCLALLRSREHHLQA